MNTDCQTKLPTRNMYKGNRVIYNKYTGHPTGDRIGSYAEKTYFRVLSVDGEKMFFDNPEQYNKWINRVSEVGVPVLANDGEIKGRVLRPIYSLAKGPAYNENTWEDYPEETHNDQYFVERVQL